MKSASLSTACHGDLIKVIEPFLSDPVSRSDNLQSDNPILIYDIGLRYAGKAIESGELILGIEKDGQRHSRFCDKLSDDILPTCINTHCKHLELSPNDLQRKGIIPRPDSIEAFMALLKMGFNSGAVGETRAIMQFRFSGNVEGSCYFIIENGTIEATSGIYEKPDLTIEAPFDVWMDIVTGKADSQEMFMKQGYTAVGDLSLLMQMNQLFG
jgi:hypothetical protein